MKLYADKLESHLKRTLAPVYLLHGDEALQLAEGGDQIRRAAREAGHDERTVFHPADDADWAAVTEAMESLSLFADKKLIELRLPTGKPGRRGAEILKRYCQSPHDDVLLLIIAGKLDRSATSSAWFKAIDKAGVSLAVYPLSVAELPRWLEQRLGGHGLQADAEALAAIVERVEGNLLAAQQEVERLALLYPDAALTREHILDAVADSARYSVGDLSQAALNGQTDRALKILDGLQAEAVSEVLILFSLSQEIRAGARVAESVEAGAGVDAALRTAGVWKTRIVPLKQALSRHRAANWLIMLSACARIDRLTKGQFYGAFHVSVWDALSALIIYLAGKGKFPVSPHSKLPL